MVVLGHMSEFIAEHDSVQIREIPVEVHVVGVVATNQAVNVICPLITTVIIINYFITKIIIILIAQN